MMWKWISENYKLIGIGLLGFVFVLGLYYLKYQSAKIESLKNNIVILNTENEKVKHNIDCLLSDYQKISNSIETFDKNNQIIQNKVNKNNSDIRQAIQYIKDGYSTDEEKLNKFNELNKSLMAELMTVNERQQE